jgi:energy-coupling factor transporter ATP-binding protein EcfA2
MHIGHLVIKNFRAIEDIQLSLVPTGNVIVGPNAVGKTTILQALRLVKALLAPRAQNEAQQTLISLSAASPHFPNKIAFEALARDISKPVEIRASVVFNPVEMELLRNSGMDIARDLAAAQLGISFQNPANLIQFFASQQGIAVVKAGQEEFDGFLNGLHSEGNATLARIIREG